MQSARRRDPYPWTWELPTTICLALSLALAVGVQMARTVANLLARAGWTWPDDQAAFWRSLPGVLSGDSSAGLSGSIEHSSLASPSTVWIAIALVELALSASVGFAVLCGMRRWGPGRLQGMASQAEAEQMLGLSRLRKVSSLVRPDLSTPQDGSPR